MTNARLRYLEDKYQSHFYFYKPLFDEEPEGYNYRKNELTTVRKPLGKKFERKFHFEIAGDLPVTRHGIIENFILLIDEKLLPRIYVCDKMKNCRFSSNRKSTFDRHRKACGNFNVKKIICKQKSYGDNENILKDIANAGYIPFEALDYKNFTLCTWDIETLENRYSNSAPKFGMVLEADLRLLSIAVGSNLPNYKPKCWIRKNLEPSEERRLIRKFLDELELIHKKKMESLPEWLWIGIEKIQEDIEEKKRLKAKSWEYNHLTRFKLALESLTHLDVFGYNSSKFDLPTIMGPLVLELSKRTKTISVLKKMSGYLSLRTERFSFKDALKVIFSMI